MMETDVFVTKDDVVVCCHDKKLGRLTNAPGTTLSDYNFADLPPLRQKIPYGGFQKGSYTQTALDDGQWLTLFDLLAKMPDTVLYSIDLKFTDWRKVEFVYADIAANNSENRVVWGSAFDKVHERCSELAPNIAKYYPARALLWTYFLQLLGCLFCFELPGDVLLGPLFTPELFKRSGFSLLVRCLIFPFVKILQIIGCCLFPHLQRRGNSIVLWTANEKSEFNKIDAWYGDSIDGLMTDEPSTLAEWVDNRQTMQDLFFGSAKKTTTCQ